MASNLVPGTSKQGTIDPAANLTISTGQTLKPGYVGSVTQNPLTNVEAGRTQASSAYVTIDNNGNPLPDFAPIGAVTAGILTGTVSIEDDGTYTAVATTVSPVGGTGCTVTYDVASNVASNLSIVAGGTGYEVNDVLTVTGDTGVQITIQTIV